jgi:glycosyltransferase involved in cell wall biosynthesis
MSTEGAPGPRGRRPFISVAIPTFRRPAMLERAVLSVAAQAFRDREIVVSDDEPGGGETWSLLRRLRGEVPGLRVFKNRLGPGQVGNTNNALLRSRGAWIKPLHDDDRLRPGCLEAFAALAARFPDAGCISCVYDRVTPAGSRGPPRRLWRPALERLGSGEAVRALYLLEEEGHWAQPSVTLVPRRAVEDGVLFEEPEGVRRQVDGWFYARLAARGGLVVLRRPLVEYHVGHERATTGMSPEEFRREVAALRRHMRALVPEGRGLPPAAAVAGMVDVLQGLVRVRRGRLGEAARLFARVRHPRALALAARWALHEASGGLISQVRRERLDAAGITPPAPTAPARSAPPRPPA